MGKRSATKNVNKMSPKKTRLCLSKEKAKTTKKPSNGKKGEGDFNDVDSLVFLNDPKENKKLKGIDERIKLLKSELKSLIGSNKTDIETVNFGENQKCVEESHENEAADFAPNCNSTPSKFSDWLENTIDLIDSHSCETPISESLLNLKSNPTSVESPPKTFLKTCSKVSLLPQQKVEELLFRSYLLQHNSAPHSSGSEVSSSEQDKTLSEIDIQEKKQSQKLTKFKKPQRKPTRGRPAKSNSGSKACQKLPQRRKRRRIVSSSESDIEIIDLESSSGNNTVPKKNIVCVDLDVSSYDWNEPFEVDNNTEFHSDIQVLEENEEKKNNDKTTQEKFHNPEEYDKNNSLNDTGNISQKKVWECPVCFDQSKGQEIVATQCGHIFCRKCLENHISKLTNNCPSCRCNLRKNKPFITLFNF